MPATPAFVFSRQKMARMLALKEWMDNCNKNGKIRHHSFRKIIQDQQTKRENPNLAEYEPTGYTHIQASDVQFEDIGEKGNEPSLEDFLEYIFFIEEINASKGTMSLNVGVNDFKNYKNKPSEGLLQALADPDADNKATYQLACASRMLETLVEYRKEGFQAIDDGVEKASTETKAAYNTFNQMLGHAVSRQASNISVTDPGATGATKVGYSFLRALIILPLAPLLIVAGGPIVFLLSLYKKLSGSTISIDYTNPLSAGLDQLTYDIGGSAQKYFKQAGLDFDGMSFSWPSLRTPHNIVTSLSWIWITVAEFIVKSIFLVPKGILNALGLPPDSYLRRGVDGLESFFIGVLSAPAIAVNHALAAIYDLWDKTWSSFDQDPGLQTIAGWLNPADEKAKKRLDLANPKWYQVPWLVLYKAFRIIFDTFPLIISAAIVKTLRSIIPGASNPALDKYFDFAEKAVYGVLFSINAIFFISLFAVALGATLPPALVALFGAGEAAHWGNVGAKHLAEAFINQIGNVATVIWDGLTTGVKDVFSYLLNNISPVDNAETVANVAKESGNAIEGAFKGLDTVAKQVGAAIGGFFGVLMLMTAGGMGYEAYNEEKNKDKNTDKIIPDDPLKKAQEKAVKKVPDLPNNLKSTSAVSPDKQATSNLTAAHDRFQNIRERGTAASDLTATNANVEMQDMAPSTPARKRKRN